MPAITSLGIAAAAPAVRALSALAGRIGQGLKQLADRMKNRRDAFRLADLDDRMLADIGLTRGDVRDAFSEPVWRDPTAILVSRAQERRINRRGRSAALAPKSFDAPSIVPAPGHATRAKVDARYY
jgi:uncharacterized protein YjiS (DUF1127 family)